MAKEIKKKYAIGVDVGGTSIKGILFDGENILMDYKLSTPKDSLEAFLTMLYAVIDPLLEEAKKGGTPVSGIGLGVPGPIDYRNQKILNPPNLPNLSGVKLAEEIAKKYGLPAFMDNDANCFMIAEASVGSARKAKNAIGITVGTGIGGGLWLNGDIFRGSTGSAGEPGQVVIEIDKEITFEQAFHKLTQNNPASLAEEAYRGDVLAEKVFKELGKYLGLAFANLVNLLDPEIIVVGGGVVESSDLFMSEAKKTMRKHISLQESKKVKLLKAKLGEHAGAIGAALLVK
jgi:glucokinase